MTTQESSPRSSIVILDNVCGAEVTLMKLRQCSGLAVLDQVVVETPTTESIGGASPLRRKDSLLDQDDEEEEETEHEYPPYSCCVWQSHDSVPLQSTTSTTKVTTNATTTAANTAATRKTSHRRRHNHRRNLTQSFAPSPPRVLKVRSFSAAENITLHTTASRKSSKNKTQPSLWQCGASLEAIEETSSPQRVLQDQENDGYMSDPELVIIRTQKSSSPRWTSLLQHQHDDALLVQVLWNLPLHVVWHVSSVSKKNNKTLPIVAYVEKGHLLSRTVVPPKLVWRPRRRTVNVSSPTQQQQQHLELLQIQRILPWQRHGVQIHYKDSHKNKNAVLHLECPTHKDRNVLVYSIKVLISRLASALIVAGDENKQTLLHEEFFYPSDRVPGGWE